MNWLKEYFTYHRGERRIVIALLALLFLLLLAIFFVNFFPPEPEPVDFSEFDNKAASFLAAAEKDSLSAEEQQLLRQQGEYTTTAIPALNPFPFDPNTLNKEGFLQLGLNERLAQQIINYRNKGGKFRRKEDFQKIYGLQPVVYKALEPFIVIEGELEKKFTEREAAQDDTIRRTYTRKSNVVVEVNSADSATLTTLYGIGPAFASRIIQYRNRLGGFVRKEQLQEVFGIDSTNYYGISAQISIDEKKVHKLNINTAEFKELNNHPYISFKQANAILRYKEQHGNFKSVEDLGKIHIISAEDVERLRPYVAVE